MNSLFAFFAQLSDKISPEIIANIAIVGVGIGAALLFYVIFFPLFGKKKTPNPDTEDEADPGLFGKLTPALAGVLPEGEKETQEFNVLLKQAGFYKSSTRNSIYALRLLLLLTPIFLGLYLGVLIPDQMIHYLMIGLFLGVSLAIIPRLYVYFHRRKRLAQIRMGLADTIDMFGMCASGGMTTSESLEHVADQMVEYPELTRELRILRRQAEVGSLEMAAADMVQRINIPEIRHFATLLIRGSQLGTQMTGSLNEQADHLRTMRRHMALAQANKTPTKLVFPLMFCFAPAALILLLSPALMEVQDFMSSGTMNTENMVDAINSTSQETPTIKMD